MITTCVYVEVKPEYVDAFIEATYKNHAASIQEPGNLRFDVLQDKEDLTKFLLYEAYVNEESAVAHKNTAHYLAWRDTVEKMMANPRKGVRYTMLFPKVCS